MEHELWAKHMRSNQIRGCPRAGIVAKDRDILTDKDDTKCASPREQSYRMAELLYRSGNNSLKEVTFALGLHVQCVMCVREEGRKNSLGKGMVISTLLTGVRHNKQSQGME